jgi:hypothetical protein
MKKLFILLSIILPGILYGQGMNVMHNGNRATYESGGVTVPDVLTNTDSTLGWWEVASANITTDGQDSCTQLNDLSGNDNHLTASDGTGAAPYYEPGSDSLSFDGVGQYIGVNIAAADQPVTYYAVFRKWFETDNQALFGGNNTAVGKVYLRSSDRPAMYSGATLTATGGDIPDGTWVIGTFKWDGANSYMKINNVTEVSGDAGSSNPDAFSVGNVNDGSVAFTRMTFKAGVVSVATSAETETEIYNYFKEKYGF